MVQNFDCDRISYQLCMKKVWKYDLKVFNYKVVILVSMLKKTH